MRTSIKWAVLAAIVLSVWYVNFYNPDTDYFYFHALMNYGSAVRGGR